MDIVKKEEIEHSKPLGKNGQEYAYASSAKIFETKQLFIYSEKVEPGKKASAPHFHKAIDEVVLVTKGRFLVVEGEKRTTLNQGDFACFYANSKELHYLENTTQETAEFLIMRKTINANDVVF